MIPDVGMLKHYRQEPSPPPATAAVDPLAKGICKHLGKVVRQVACDCWKKKGYLCDVIDSPGVIPIFHCGENVCSEYVPDSEE